MSDTGKMTITDPVLALRRMAMLMSGRRSIPASADTAKAWAIYTNAIADELDQRATRHADAVAEIHHLYRRSDADHGEFDESSSNEGYLAGLRHAYASALRLLGATPLPQQPPSPQPAPQPIVGPCADVLAALGLARSVAELDDALSATTHERMGMELADRIATLDRYLVRRAALERGDGK